MLLRKHRDSSTRGVVYKKDEFLFKERGFDIHLIFWADPGGTAIPGQPVEKPEQAPVSSPRSKNQFNIEVPRWGTYQILS